MKNEISRKLLSWTETLFEKMRAIRAASILSPSFAFIRIQNKFLPTRCLHLATAAGSEAATDRFWEACVDCWRPNVEDVDRISWGKPAKKKGTGSRGVPHRLNREERTLFDLARKKGHLEVAGSAWRAQRREAPLLNTYRSYCDARGVASVVLQKSEGGDGDLVTMDLSPLRRPDAFRDWAEECARRVQPLTPEIPDASDDDNSDYTPADDGVDSWKSRPIYQLPPFYITWSLQRADAKKLCKQLSSMFETGDPKVSRSRKPVGVKPGKGRRSGGYGIG